LKCYFHQLLSAAGYAVTGTRNIGHGNEIKTETDVNELHPLHARSHTWWWLH